MINKQFPSAYDVEQTIKFRTTPYASVLKYYQSHGLLNIGSGKEHLAQFAPNILLEHQDYLELRTIALGSEGSNNISGFNVNATLVPKTTEDLLEDIKSLRSRLTQQETKIRRLGAPSQRLTMPIQENGDLRVQYEYQRIILGRVELMQTVDTEVEFVIETSGNQKWQVVCFPKANQDVKKIESIFRILDGGAYEPSAISLQQFTRQQRIQLFDEILDYYTDNSEWEFREVVGITIRQDNPNEQRLILVDEEDEYNNDDDRLEEAEETDLLSITQAVLEGQRLRTNSFVKRCERQGFYFPSMTLLLHNRKTPEIVQVMVRFKLSPKMFEVILSYMGEMNPMGVTDVAFPKSRQQEILREFWDLSHKIWDSIDAKVIRSEQNQLTMADYIANLS